MKLLHGFIWTLIALMFLAYLVYATRKPRSGIGARQDVQYAKLIRQGPNISWVGIKPRFVPPSR